MMVRRSCDVSGCYIRAPTTFPVKLKKLHVYKQLGYQFKPRREIRICEAHFEARFILRRQDRPDVLHKDAVPLPVNDVRGDALTRTQAALGLKGEAEAIASSGIPAVAVGVPRLSTQGGIFIIQGVSVATGGRNANKESVHHNTEALEYCEVKMESLSDHEGDEHKADEIEEQQYNTEVNLENSSAQKQRHDWKIFTCSQCEFTGSRTGVWLHKKAEHEGSRYSCDQCEFVATIKQTLQRHKESEHAGIKFPCDQCEHIASNKSNLNRHKKSKHEGVKYPCAQCEYVSSRTSHLKWHIESRHK